MPSAVVPPSPSFLFIKQLHFHCATPAPACRTKNNICVHSGIKRSHLLHACNPPHCPSFALTGWADDENADVLRVVHSTPISAPTVPAVSLALDKHICFKKEIIKWEGGGKYRTIQIPGRRSCEYDHLYFSRARALSLVRVLRYELTFCGQLFFYVLVYGLGCFVLCFTLARRARPSACLSALFHRHLLA